MEGIDSASEVSDKKEDLGANDSLPASSTKALVMDLNLQFYQGKIVSQPHGVTVDQILSWYDDLSKLETYHGYIQWLFPTSQPSSSNRYAQPLQPEEAEAIQQDKMARKRFLTAYLMMLEFYGLTIVDFGTGSLARTEHYKDRFVNLNNSTHNHIRITRILKSLGEIGLERYQFQLVKFLLAEAIWYGQLLNTIPSARDFWIEAVKDASERSILKDYAAKLAKEVLDSVAPHANKGKEPCNCQRCTALRELRKMVPDHKPKAKAHGTDVCTDPHCICRNKVYISSDHDQMAAQRVVLIEDLSHLTLELGKISARLNVAAAERAQQKTMETPEQIEELACLMDEVKQVSIALGSVTAKMATLALGEKIIQKKESEMAAKRDAVQSAEACTEEEPCPAVEESIHDAAPKTTKTKMGALREDSEKRAAGLNQHAPHTALDPQREVERANSPLTQQTFTSTEEENAAPEDLSTIKYGSHSGASVLTGNRHNGQDKTESSAAEKRHLSNELVQKEEVQASHEKIPERMEKDPIILMTERLFSESNSSLDAAQGSRKKKSSEPTRVLSPEDRQLKDLSIAEAKREGFDDASKKSGTFEETNGADEEANLSTNDNNHARPADEALECEDAFEEPAWMKAFKERSARDKAA